MRAAIALATDFNPGHQPNVQHADDPVARLCHACECPRRGHCCRNRERCFMLRAIDRIGSPIPGKQADIVVMNAEDYREIPYHFGVNLTAMTLKRA